MKSDQEENVEKDLIEDQNQNNDLEDSDEELESPRKIFTKIARKKEIAKLSNLEKIESSDPDNLSSQGEKKETEKESDVSSEEDNESYDSENSEGFDDFDEGDEDENESQEKDEDDILDNNEKNEKKDKKRKRKDKSKINKSKDKKTKKSKKSKSSALRLFSEYANVADESDEEEEEYDKAEASMIQTKDEELAYERLRKRHEQSDQYWQKSAEEITKELSERYKYQAQFKKRFESGEGFATSEAYTSVDKQSLLPGIKDPKLFMLRCSSGFEQALVRSILLKSMDLWNKGHSLKIKSAVYTGIRGTIFLESSSEVFVKEMISGLNNIYTHTLRQVPIAEMTQVMTVTVKKKPLKVGQWVRIKRGVLKGDLARIVSILDGGEKLFIQAVPRPDYSAETSQDAVGVKAKFRPLQKLFDPEQAQASGKSSVLRRYHPLDDSDEPFDVWNNDYYKNGLLYKEVNAKFYINADNPQPKLDEIMLFQAKKDDRVDDEYENFDGRSSENKESSVSSILTKELVEQIQNMGTEKDKKSSILTFFAGDLAQVMSGELKGLVVKIKSIDQLTKVATATPIDESFQGPIEVELSLLEKYISPGDHIKVIEGQYIGQTGRVVGLKSIDGVNAALILTDITNTEISVSINKLKITNEVSTGNSNLKGYELYDLVSLNDNETAMVTFVGTERLNVINHLDVLKDVSPMEISTKLNAASARTSSFDLHHTQIKEGDIVNVVSGTHAKHSGTIKRMMKGILWIHNNSYLKNSGILVAKARNCVVTGKTNQPGGLVRHGTMLSQGSPLSSTPHSQSSRSTSSMGSFNKRGNDSLIGKTVRITRGGYKGYLAQVVDATPTHFSLELLSKTKRVFIEKEKTMVVGDKDGKYEAENETLQANLDILSTPFLTSQTPMHFAGGETPDIRMGSETPMSLGNNTPSSYSDSNIWRANQSDIVSKHSAPSSAYGSSSAHKGWESISTISTFTPSEQYNSSKGPSVSSHIFDSSNDSVRSSISSLPDPSLASSGKADGIPPEAWEKNMIVLIKKGENTGKLAVILDPMNEDGQLGLSLRDGTGRLIKTKFSMHFSEVNLADPPKKETVVAKVGKFAGKEGVVKSKKGKDLVVMFSDSSSLEIVKLSAVAWINKEK